MLAVLRTAGVVQDVHQGAQLQSHAYVETSSGPRTQFPPGTDTGMIERIP